MSFRDWLRSVDDLGWPLASSLLDGGARLVVRSGATLDEPAPVVHLTASEQSLDGVRLGEVGVLADRLLALLDLRRRTMAGSPFLASPRVYLAIDADVAWERIALTLAEIGKAGFDRLSFVFADPTRTRPEPLASTIAADLARLDKAGASKRQQILVELLAYVYHDCASALAVIAQLGHEVAELHQALVEELPSAIEKCGCQADDASARALHWALFGNPHPGSVVTIQLAALGNKPARVLSVPASLSWNDAHTLLVTTGEGASVERIGFEVSLEPPQKDDKRKPAAKPKPPLPPRR